jgi:hypothetical protein
LTCGKSDAGSRYVVIVLLLFGDVEEVLKGRLRFSVLTRTKKIGRVLDCLLEIGQLLACALERGNSRVKKKDKEDSASHDKEGSDEAWERIIKLAPRHSIILKLLEGAAPKWSND